uniref:Syndecan/Neurexin domain-containing protein n=1 Tax=Ciona intestinalis TaxID=7719 RepID=F7BGJ1_CIOIN
MEHLVFILAGCSLMFVMCGGDKTNKEVETTLSYNSTTDSVLEGSGPPGEILDLDITDEKTSDKQPTETSKTAVVLGTVAGVMAAAIIVAVAYVMHKRRSRQLNIAREGFETEQKSDLLRIDVEQKNDDEGFDKATTV